MQQPSIFKTGKRQRFTDAGDVVFAGAKSVFRHKRLLIASIGLVVAIAASWDIRDSAVYERTDEAQVDGRVLPLSAQISGNVQQIHVVDNQLVHAGDVLATIDQRPYTIAVLEALANLAYAQNSAAALYFKAAITTTTVYSDLAAAQAGFRDAAVELQNAEHKVRADEAVLMQAQVDGPLAEAVAAADQQVLLQAQDKLAEAITNLGTAKTAPERASLAKVEAQAADAQVLQRKAELDKAQLNLSYTMLRSPITGIVGRRRLEVGQSVNVGQDLIDIVSVDDVWITANFKETQLARLRPGQPVEIKIDAYRGTWKGHVTNLGGGVNSLFSSMAAKASAGNHGKNSQRLPVRIDFDRSEGREFNAESMLKPGLSAESEVRVR
jgi:membrane fusion protein (multidrug efflux system)